jgi:hypothetical protein
VIIPLRRKYMVNQVKKQGSARSDSGSGKNKSKKKPAPVSRIRTMVLVEGRKVRFEG